MSLNKKLTEKEIQMIQDQIDNTYELFLERVSSGRNRTKNEINTVARGRVWTGTDALKRGLVDELGGLNEALSFAIKTAKISEPKIIHYPLASENQLANFLELFEEGDEFEENGTSSLTINALNFIKSLQTIENSGKIQMRMPYLININ